MFQLAVRDQIIRNNPTDQVMSELRKKSEEPDKRHALTLEQERAFLGFLNEPENVRWRPLFTVMFGTGSILRVYVKLYQKPISAFLCKNKTI